jgi:hypothetical protein
MTHYVDADLSNFIIFIQSLNKNYFEPPKTFAQQKNLEANYKIDEWYEKFYALE